MRRAALALSSGVLVALSLPPWGFWPLAFVGIALFECTLGTDATARQRAARGWLFGAGWLFPGMGWMWFLTAPGYVVVGAMFAGLHALAAVVAPTGRWRVFGRPAAHTAVEALRLFMPFGGVPLATVALGQAGGPLLGVARVGGVIALTWVVFQIGIALGALAETRRAGRLELAALGAAATVVVLAVVAPTGHATGRTLRVTLVQGGGPQGTLAINTNPRDVVERHLAATRTIEPGSTDLVVWPENVIDVPVFAESPEYSEVAAEAARIGAPFAVGITEDVPAGMDGTAVDGPGAFLNAQVMITPMGATISRYDKVRRVPFGEYMPMRGLLAAFGAPVNQVPRDAIAGTGPAVLNLPDGTRLGVVISWEVFFGNRARDGIEHGAQMIINPTNGSSYTGTVLQTQQVASSRLRAVESGRWVAQVAPTGFSAFVTDSGDVIDRTGVSEQKVIHHDVTLRAGNTWYVSLGNGPFVAATLLVFSMSLVPGMRVRRGRRPESERGAPGTEPTALTPPASP